MGVWERVVSAVRRGAGVLRGRSELLLPSVSLARVLPGPIVEQIVGYCVLAVAFAVAAPKVYPDSLDVEEDTGLRATFVVVAVAFSVAFTWVRTSILGAVLAFGTLLGTIVWFDLYLAHRKQWDLFDTEGEAVALVDEIAPHDLRKELAEDFARIGWRRRIAVGAWLGALGTFFALPAFLAGLLGALVGTTFPFPDALLVAVVSFDAATRAEYTTDPFDVENRLYSTVSAATRSLEGAVFVFLTAYGVLLSAQIFVTASQWSIGFTGRWSFGTTDFPTLWNAFGVVAVLVAVGAYDLWVWVRAIDRLPDVLDVRDHESTAKRSAVPPYPRGLTVPPTLALVALVAFLPLADLARSQRVTFAVVWPLLLVWLGGCTYSSLFSLAKASTVEIWLVVAALLVQSVGRAVFVHAGDLVAAATDTLLLFSLVAVPLIAYLPAVVRYATRHDDARRYATGLYLLYLAAVTAVVSLTASGQTAIAVRAFALGVFTGGAVLLLAEYLFP